MKIDWLKLFMEFAVVLLGIIIAFQLNTCSTDSQNRDIVDNHFQQIVDETNVNNYNLLGAINIVEINLQKLDSLIMEINRMDDLERINKLSVDLLNIGKLYFRKNAYIALIESGDFRLIEDFQAKQDVINLYEYYKWAESYDQLSLKNYTEDYYPYLKANLDLVGGTIQSVEVYKNKKFINTISAYRYSSINKLKKLKECQSEILNFLNKYDNP